MATIKELNNAIRIMREHCNNQPKNGDCDVCLLNKVCEKIDWGSMPALWDEIEDEDGKQDVSDD